MKNNLMKSGIRVPFVYYHLPMILYASAIITISSIPSLHTPDLPFFGLDKLAHFLEYALFAFLTFRSFTNIKPILNLTLAYSLSLVFLILFALIDEFYQSFVPGRFSDIGDFIVDILSAFMVLTYFWIRRRKLKEATK